MAKKTDCGTCGAPRPGQTRAGTCDGCFALHRETCAFNVRVDQAHWRQFVAERTERIRVELAAVAKACGLHKPKEGDHG